MMAAAAPSPAYSFSAASMTKGASSSFLSSAGGKAYPGASLARSVQSAAFLPDGTPAFDGHALIMSPSFSSSREEARAPSTNPHLHHHHHHPSELADPAGRVSMTSLASSPAQGGGGGAAGLQPLPRLSAPPPVRTSLTPNHNPPARQSFAFASPTTTHTRAASSLSSLPSSPPDNASYLIPAARPSLERGGTSPSLHGGHSTWHDSWEISPAPPLPLPLADASSSSPPTRSSPSSSLSSPEHQQQARSRPTSSWPWGGTSAPSTPTRHSHQQKQQQQHSAAVRLSPTSSAAMVVAAAADDHNNSSGSSASYVRTPLPSSLDPHNNNNNTNIMETRAARRGTVDLQAAAAADAWAGLPPPTSQLSPSSFPVPPTTDAWAASPVLLSTLTAQRSPSALSGATVSSAAASTAASLPAMLRPLESLPPSAAAGAVGGSIVHGILRDWVGSSGGGDGGGGGDGSPYAPLAQAGSALAPEEEEEERPQPQEEQYSSLARQALAAGSHDSSSGSSALESVAQVRKALRVLWGGMGCGTRSWCC